MTYTLQQEQEAKYMVLIQSTEQPANGSEVSAEAGHAARANFEGARWK
jgi:hypothetical protein